MTATAWQGTIRGGKVDWRDKQGIQQYIAVLEGKRVLITIEEFSGKRTLNQNAYFHGPVCEAISDATGFETEEVKILMKAMFLYRVDRRGRIHLRETSRLNRRQMSEFIEQVIRWAAVWLEVAVPPAESCAESWAA